MTRGILPIHIHVAMLLQYLVIFLFDSHVMSGSPSELIHRGFGQLGGSKSNILKPKKTPTFPTFHGRLTLADRKTRWSSLGFRVAALPNVRLPAERSLVALELGPLPGNESIAKRGLLGILIVRSGGQLRAFSLLPLYDHVNIEPNARHDLPMGFHVARCA